MPHILSYLFSRALGLLVVGSILTAPAATSQETHWPLFAMDNGVGRGVWTPEQQASTLVEVGFEGISYNYTRADDILRWREQLERRRLALRAIYLPVRLEGERMLPPELEKAVENLRGSGAALWLTIPVPAKPGDHEPVALERIRQVADLAATAGLRVVLYPHHGFYLATAEHAMILVQKSQRANVGMTLNLSHELAARNGRRLHDIIRAVAPHLELVSINGASDVAGGGWGDFIKVLGQGDYDVGAILRVLREVNYTGPVGVQFYNVKGEPKANLAATVNAWKTLITELASETNP